VYRYPPGIGAAIHHLGLSNWAIKRMLHHADAAMKGKRRAHGQILKKTPA
jgi:hypothetical protein